MKRIAVAVFLSTCLSAFAAKAYVLDSNDSHKINYAAVHDAHVSEPLVIETKTFEVPLPDFSTIDFAAIEEERRIVRQMEIDEARMLYGKCGEWHELAMQIGWPEEEWETLSEIMWRESNCIVDAWSGSDAGLMQINRVHTEWSAMMGWSWPEDLFVAENNLTFAYRLWSESGWSPWRFSGPVPD